MLGETIGNNVPSVVAKERSPRLMHQEKRGKWVSVTGPRSPAPALAAASTLNATQHRVLRELARLTTPVTVDHLSDSMALHANTVRDALGVLLEKGLAERTQQSSVGRGRPSWLYQAVVSVSPSQIVSEFGSFAEAVALQMTAESNDPTARAFQLGQIWGDQILLRDSIPDHDEIHRRRAAASNASNAPNAPDASDASSGSNTADTYSSGTRHDKDDYLCSESTTEALGQEKHAHSLEAPTTKLRILFSELGFEARPGTDACDINLFQCPLTAPGPGRAELVCEIHRGMIERVVGRLSGGQVRTELTPNAGPDYCRVRLVHQASA